MTIKTNCIHFRGDVPCKPHKKSGIHCYDCTEYKNISEVLLIIKLGAIGDVIRTTPLLRKLKEEKPNAYIYWLTYTPDIVSKDWVNRVLTPSVENIELLKNIEFDWLINLDKDPIAIALTKSITAKKKTGFTIDNFGHAKPISTSAENHKWLTGLFDDLNKANTKHYIQEIFEICGYQFKNEEYILDVTENMKNYDIDKTRKIIGLNTGCGGRWTSRLWPTEHWIELAKTLLNINYEVVLLGGEQEDKKNKLIQKETGAKYFGYFSLPVFISLMDKCDLIVTAVTMGMHLAIGLKKELVLFNNIFNRNEFYLYNRGVILEPGFECNCFFSPTCKNNCMQYIYPQNVISVIDKLISG